MRRRKTAGTLAVVLSFTGLAACASYATTPVDPAPVASTASTPDPGAVNALAQLHAWLDRLGTANISINTFETGTASDAISTRLELTGIADVATGSVQATGSQWTWSDNESTLQTQFDAVEAGGVLYSTVTPARNANSSESSSPKEEWTSTPVNTVRLKESTHSAWWLALQSLKKVDHDGQSAVLLGANSKGATEYTGTIDLNSVPGIPPSFLSAPLFKKAGSTEVSVDLYTDMGTGALVKLTYRFGLRVSVDSTASGQSTAGYDVDLTGFGSPIPLSTPVVVPASKYVISGGNDELCRLLIF